MRHTGGHVLVCVTLSKFDDIFLVFAESYLRNISSPLLVVDDGLSDDLKSKYKMFRYIRSAPPFAFCTAMNAALTASAPDDVLRFDDDCIIHTKDTDLIMQNVAYSDDDIGLVGPMMTNVMNPGQLPENKVDDDYIISALDISFGCVYLKRSAIDKVGLLDQGYRHGVAGWEDRDYSIRLRQAGYKLAITHKCFVQHGGPEFGTNISNTRGRVPGQLARLDLNGDYFVRKFGVQR